MSRFMTVLVMTLLLAHTSALGAQVAPAPPAPAAALVPPAPPAPPAPEPARALRVPQAPPPPGKPGQNVNVQIELTIKEVERPPQMETKVVSMVVSDATWGRPVPGDHDLVRARAVQQHGGAFHRACGIGEVTG